MARYRREASSKVSASGIIFLKANLLLYMAVYPFTACQPLHHAKLHTTHRRIQQSLVSLPGSKPEL